MLQNKISHGKFEAGKSFRKAIVQAQFRKDLEVRRTILEITAVLILRIT